MADSLLRVRTRPIEVWSIRPVILQLRAHVFNGTIWPDFTRLPSPRNPILSFHEIREGQQQRIGKHEVLAVRVHHTVEAAGYLVSDGKASIIFGSDTGPTAELWEVANRAAGLQAIIVEASYPNRLEDLAGVSGHLTPIKGSRKCFPL
jgi:cAMP phosphodiesterase